MNTVIRKIITKINLSFLSGLKDIPSQELITASLIASDMRKQENSHGIIFSKDRAMQLESLLGSYVDLVSGGPLLTILYSATTKEHDGAYKQVFDQYQQIIDKIIFQPDRQSFRRLLIEALEKQQSEYIFFLVDDVIFIEPIDFFSFSMYSTTYSVPSLRMGLNLSESYTVNKKQKLPPYFKFVESAANKNGSEDLCCWRWSNGVLDWGYPLSVDGHIFKYDEMLNMIKSIEFDSPNSFEVELQKFIPAFQWRLGICFKKSRLVNIPFNRVQNDFNNISGKIHPDLMLKWWKDGKRINRTLYYGMDNVSAHQEMEIELIDR